MYTLGALEVGRVQAQVLHDDDPCCYSAKRTKEGIRNYNSFVQSNPELGGWMQTYVTTGNIHMVNLRDKAIALNVVERFRRYGEVDRDFMAFMPFDILNGPTANEPSELMVCLETNAEACLGKVGEGGLVKCLVTNKCLQMDGDALDIGKLTNCIVPVPIFNPRPACEDKINAMEALSCLGGCNEDPRCMLGCIADNVDIAPGIAALIQCILPDGVCGGIVNLSPRP
jgi:hypothetical protein